MLFQLIRWIFVTVLSFTAYFTIRHAEKRRRPKPGKGRCPGGKAVRTGQVSE